MNSQELSKVYEPKEVEDRWIAFWLEKGIFNPDKNSSSSNEAFSIVIPPPNVTGSLHMGHALNNTLQDILARTNRMRGKKVLWVVGCDHAGIATQNVVERKLKEEGKSRFDMTREEFVKRVWQWKEESGGTIINQLKRLGASCDYDNERFTMDEGLSHAVKKVFVALYNEKLIYRGNRLINWCPRCQTALSDLEVEHKVSAGKIWKIKYPFVNNPEALVVATTRPETLFGDVALAVNPLDERYQNLIGQFVRLPLTDRDIPIIADEFVDREFGSGVVKITPAHDFNDFAVGQRHGLESRNILDRTAKLEGPWVPHNLQGKDRLEARKEVLKALKESELLIAEEDYQNSVGQCYRCQTVVEPYLTDQWFVDAKTLAKPAIEAVKTAQTRFIPEHWEKTYFNWMENIQDWCISRQIWWGHQIPAWYCGECAVKGKTTSQSGEYPGLHVQEEKPAQCSVCGSKNLIQDEDVLDTWFSSALWPFSTLGWPDETKRLKTFYPTSVLVTAFDIIFFWVARMMMMGIHFMKEVPFKDVHIHALVRDPMGQKMSKSKGNVVDPLVMMHKYGTDAFRFTLTAFAAQGRDIKLDEARIEGYRNFCNKIWNASRFALMNAKPYVSGEKDFENFKPSLDINQWILFKLDLAIQKVSGSVDSYDFNQAAHSIYTFFWNDFCDAYIELSKFYFTEGTEDQKKEVARCIYFILDNSLRLLHPFMPFISEEIWQILAERGGKSIALSPYPQAFDTQAYASAHDKISLALDALSAIRSIRQETGLPANQKLIIEIETAAQWVPLYDEIMGMISKLGKIETFSYRTGQLTEQAALARLQNGYLAVPLSANGIDPVKEGERVTKKLAKVEKDISQLKLRLDDPKFMANAEAPLIAEKKAELQAMGELKDLLDKEKVLLS